MYDIAVWISCICYMSLNGWPVIMSFLVFWYTMLPLDVDPWYFFWSVVSASCFCSYICQRVEIVSIAASPHVYMPQFGHRRFEAWGLTGLCTLCRGRQIGPCTSPDAFTLWQIHCIHHRIFIYKLSWEKNLELSMSFLVRISCQILFVHSIRKKSAMTFTKQVFVFSNLFCRDVLANILFLQFWHGTWQIYVYM